MVPFIVFGLGIVVTIVVQSYFRKLSDESSLINDLIGDVARIEEVSIKYWLSGLVAPKMAKITPEEDAALAAQVRGAVHATGCFSELAEKILLKKVGRFNELDGQIFDLTTGGSFETIDRKPDYRRVVEIMASCNQMRSLLRSARWQKLWAH